MPFTAIDFLWLAICLALGAGYALLLYRQPVTLNTGLRNTLFAFRTIVIATLAFLLIAPLVRTVNTTLEKPLIILAQDGSASIGIGKDKNFNPSSYAREYSNLEKILPGDYEVRSFSFGKDVSEGLSFKYQDKLTDITGFLTQIAERFSSRNIGAVILATDGIYNRGGNPQYEMQNIKAPVYTIALGDTVPKKDILISNVNYNNIAYLDNEFQVEVSVEAFLCKGVNTMATVSDLSGRISSKPVHITSDEYRQTVLFTLPAKSKGVQKYTLSIAAVSGELSRLNNTQTIYVEVIDGRKNILIIANAPHPDIAALKQSIEVNKNYEVSVFPGTDASQAEVARADLVILHQLPSVSNSAQGLLRQLKNKPVLFILGAQTDTELFSGAQPVLGITSARASQEALATVRKDFYRFTLSDPTGAKLGNLAPLLTPFGNYGIKGNADVLLSQQIGKVVTSMPLLLFSQQGRHRVGVLTGEGIWRWRLEEFQESGNHDAVNELISKSIQYLSAADDKRKFRAYAARNEFDENEHVTLNAELYNDAYELVNTPEVKVALKSRAGKSYSYIFSRTGNSYVLDAGILPAGEYQFDAQTRLGNNNYRSTGQFIISAQQAEFRQTTANHQLLYALAGQSGGKMIFPDQLSQLPELIKNNENIKTISYENRKYEELIDLKLVFALLLALLSTEWFLRKRNGEI